MPYQRGQVTRGAFHEGMVSETTGSTSTNFKFSLFDALNVDILPTGQIRGRLGFKKVLSFKSSDWELIKDGVEAVEDPEAGNKIFFINGRVLVIDKANNNRTVEDLTQDQLDINFISTGSTVYYDKLGKFLIRKGYQFKVDKDGKKQLESVLLINSASAPYSSESKLGIIGLKQPISDISSMTYYQQRLWLSIKNILIASKIGYVASPFILEGKGLIVEDTMDNVKKANDYLDILKPTVVSFDIAGFLKFFGTFFAVESRRNVAVNRDFTSTYGENIPPLNLADGLKFYDVEDPAVTKGTYDKAKSVVFDMFEEVLEAVFVKGATAGKYYLRVLYKNGKAFTPQSVYYSNITNSSQDETVAFASCTAMKINEVGIVRYDSVRPLAGLYMDRETDKTTYPNGIETVAVCSYVPGMARIPNISGESTSFYTHATYKKEGYITQDPVLGAPGTVFLPEMQIYVEDEQGRYIEIDKPVSCPVFRYEFLASELPTSDSDTTFITSVLSQGETVLKRLKFERKGDSLLTTLNLTSEDFIQNFIDKLKTKTIPSPTQTYTTWVPTYPGSGVPGGELNKTTDSNRTNVMITYSRYLKNNPFSKWYGGGSYITDYFPASPVKLDLIDTRKAYQSSGSDRPKNTDKTVANCLAPFLSDFSFFSIDDPALGTIISGEPRSIDFTEPKDPSNLSESDRLLFKFEDNINFIVEHRHLYLFFDDSVRFFASKQNNEINYNNDNVPIIARLKTSRNIEPVALHNTLFFFDKDETTLYKLVGVPNAESYTVVRVNERIKEVIGEVESMTADLNGNRLFVKNLKTELFVLNYLEDDSSGFTRYSLDAVSEAKDVPADIEKRRHFVDSYYKFDVEGHPDYSDALQPPYKGAVIKKTLPFLRVIDRFTTEYVKQGSLTFFSSKPLYKYDPALAEHENAVISSLIAFGLEIQDEVITERAGTPEGTLDSNVVGRTYEELSKDANYSGWAEVYGLSAKETISAVSDKLKPLEPSIMKIVKLLKDMSIELDIKAVPIVRLLSGLGYRIYEGGVDGYLEYILNTIFAFRKYCSDALHEGFLQLSLENSDTAPFSKYKVLLRRFLQAFRLFFTIKDTSNFTYDYNLTLASLDLTSIIEPLEKLETAFKELAQPIGTLFNKECVSFASERKTNFDFIVEKAVKGVSRRVKETDVLADGLYITTDETGRASLFEGKEREEFFDVAKVGNAIRDGRVVKSDGTFGALDPTDPLRVSFEALDSTVIFPYYNELKRRSISNLISEGIFSELIDLDKLYVWIPIPVFRNNLLLLELLKADVAKLESLENTDSSQLRKDMDVQISEITKSLNANQLPKSGNTYGGDFFSNFTSLLDSRRYAEAVKSLQFLIKEFALLTAKDLELVADKVPYNTENLDKVLACGNSAFLFVNNTKTKEVTVLAQKTEADTHPYLDEIHEILPYFLRIKTATLDASEEGFITVDNRVKLRKASISSVNEKAYSLNSYLLTDSDASRASKLRASLYEIEREPEQVEHHILTNPTFYDTTLTLEKHTDGSFILKNIHLIFDFEVPRD